DLGLAVGPEPGEVAALADDREPLGEAMGEDDGERHEGGGLDRKSTRLNSSHGSISYAVFCLKKKKKKHKEPNNKNNYQHARTPGEPVEIRRVHTRREDVLPPGESTPRRRNGRLQIELATCGQ